MITLPNTSLAGVAVGQSGTITFPPGGITPLPGMERQPPHLMLFNDSGSALQLFTSGGKSFNLPSGAWRLVELNNTDTHVDWTCIANLPNPPISLLTADLYSPGEPIPDFMTLGNSPIGVSGAVQTTSVQTLSNENNAVNTLVIDIGPTGLSQIISIFNDHFTWSVVQGGIAHTVLQGQVSGNPLLIGKSGDISEVLGNMLVDGTLTVTGKTTLNSATASDAAAAINFTAGGGVNNAITTGGLEIVAYNSTNGDVEVKATATGGRVLLTTSDGTARAQVDSTGLKGLTGSIFFPVAGSFKSVTRFTGTGNGTVATGTTNPFSIANDACTVSGSSQTIGMTIATSSVVTTGAALAWHGTAYN